MNGCFARSVFICVHLWFVSAVASAQGGPNWHSLGDGEGAASSSGKPIVLYVTLPGSGTMDQYIWGEGGAAVIDTQPIVEASKSSMIFIKHNCTNPDPKAPNPDPTVARYALERIPTILICDQHGNKVKQIPIGQVLTDHRESRAVRIELLSYLPKIPSLVGMLHKDVQRLYDQGEQAFEKENYRQAIQKFQKVAGEYRGLDVVAKSQARLDEMEAKAREELATALTLEGDERKKALKSIGDRYFGLPAAEEAKAEMGN